MSEEKKSKLPALELTPAVSILIVGVIIAGAIVFTNLNRPSEAIGDTTNSTDTKKDTSVAVPLPNDQDHIIGGTKDAPIVLIEYADFQCVYCQMINPSLKKIVSEGNGQVAWILRHYPLVQIHPQALPAASAAECINEQLGNTGFWKFADAVFADQQNLNPAQYEKYALQFGIDSAKYKKCIADAPYLSRIEAEAADAQVNGGNGTPYTIVLNTKTGKQFPISGALPEAQLRAVISKAKNSL